MMKISRVQIKNFRGISNKEVTLNCDSYNIIIGDNGTSKTTILEAINLCLSPGYSASQLKIKDFFLGGDSPITIYVYFDNEFDIEIPDLFGNTQKMRCHGIALIAKKRDRSAPGRAFNDLVVAEHIFIPVEPRGENGWAMKRKTGSDFKITERQLSLSYASGDYPRVFYFGKERSRQLKKGYNSSISNIIDDLNWKFEKKQRTLDDIDKFKHQRSETENYVFENTDGDTIKNTIDATNKTLKALGIEPIDLSLIRTLTPYDNTEIVKRLGAFEISMDHIGSGVEMITALIFLETVAKISKNEICIIIDEPELHLHPNLQDKLAKHLIEVSQKTQVFMSTHSPFFFKNIFATSNTSIVISELSDSNDINLIDAKVKGFGLLSWSPSWGEICYFAYGLATIEFHDDLFATLQDKNNTPTIKETESWLTAHNQTQEIHWKDSSGILKTETLMTYIRNRIHHADNASRPPFKQEQLSESILRMIELLK